MPNYNRTIIAGHITRDPETHTFQSGGKVVGFGIAVNNRKKDQASGEWKDAATFLDCKCFGSEKSKQADMIATLKKGSPVLLEGHLDQENWEDKNGGGKRSKLVLIVDSFQFLASKRDGGGQEQEGAKGSGGNSAPSQPQAGSTQQTFDDIPF